MRSGGCCGCCPPPPPSGRRPRQELPFLGAELTDILARARGDGSFRDGLRSDADATLREHGYDLSPSVLAHLMKLLPEADAEG